MQTRGGIQKPSVLLYTKCNALSVFEKDVVPTDEGKRIATLTRIRKVLGAAYSYIASRLN